MEEFPTKYKKTELEWFIGQQKRTISNLEEEVIFPKKKLLRKLKKRMKKDKVRRYKSQVKKYLGDTWPVAILYDICWSFSFENMYTLIRGRGILKLIELTTLKDWLPKSEKAVMRAYKNRVNGVSRINEYQKKGIVTLNETYELCRDNPHIPWTLIMRYKELSFYFWENLKNEEFIKRVEKYWMWNIEDEWVEEIHNNMYHLWKYCTSFEDFLELNTYIWSIQEKTYDVVSDEMYSLIDYYPILSLNDIKYAIRNSKEITSLHKNANFDNLDIIRNKFPSNLDISTIKEILKIVPDFDFSKLLFLSKAFWMDKNSLLKLIRHPRYKSFVYATRNYYGNNERNIKIDLNEVFNLFVLNQNLDVEWLLHATSYYSFNEVKDIIHNDNFVNLFWLAYYARKNVDKEIAYTMTANIQNKYPQFDYHTLYREANPTEIEQELEKKIHLLKYTKLLPEFPKHKEYLLSLISYIDNNSEKFVRIWKKQILIWHQNIMSWLSHFAIDTYSDPKDIERDKVIENYSIWINDLIKEWREDSEDKKKTDVVYAHVLPKDDHNNWFQKHRSEMITHYTQRYWSCYDILNDWQFTTPDQLIWYIESRLSNNDNVDRQLLFTLWAHWETDWSAEFWKYDRTKEHFKTLFSIEDSRLKIDVSSCNSGTKLPNNIKAKKLFLDSWYTNSNTNVQVVHLQSEMKDKDWNFLWDFDWNWDVSWVETKIYQMLYYTDSVTSFFWNTENGKWKNILHRFADNSLLSWNNFERDT